MTDVAGYDRLDTLGRDLHDRFDHVSLAAMCADLLATVNRAADAVRTFEGRGRITADSVDLNVPTPSEIIDAFSNALRLPNDPPQEGRPKWT